MDVALPPAYELQMQEVGDHLIVKLPVRRDRSDVIGASVFLAVLVGFTCFTLVHLALTHNWSDLSALFFLFLFCALFGYGLADAVFGGKALTATPLAVEYRHEIGRLVRTRVFDAALVRNIEAVAVLDGDGDPRSDFCLKFAYGKKDVRIGEEMTQREAELVAAAVLERIRPGRSWVETAVPEPPRVEPIGVRSFVFPAIVVVAIGLITYETLKSDGAAPSAHPMPQRQAFRTPRGYAGAMTAWILNSGDAKLIGRPTCGAHATWTHWSCRGRVRFVTGLSAGHTSWYHCEPGFGGGGVHCGLATRFP
jgi:hypothetical protein